jgi:hypothetical protein
VLSWYSRRPEEPVFMPEVLLLLLFNHHHRRRRRRNVFCITTRYGLEVPGIECPWGRNFPYPSRPVSMSTQLPVNGCRFLEWSVVLTTHFLLASVCEWVGLRRPPLLCLFRYVMGDL